MKIKSMKFLLFVVIVLINFRVVFGQDENKTDDSLVGSGEFYGFSKKDAELLKKNKILVTNETYKQIFSAYLTHDSYFITSDSLINAYHVLYEESIMQLEFARADQLLTILKEMIATLDSADKNINGKAELVSAAKEKAQLVTGIALRLLDNTFKFNNQKLDSLLDEEIKYIIKAEGLRKPEWLGKTDDSFFTIDISRYKPRGFYDRSEQLKSYFRAVSWLQSIPFRLRNDEEFLSILILGNTFHDRNKEPPQFFSAYSSFIGLGDDWDIIKVANNISNVRPIDLDHNGLEVMRKNFDKKSRDNEKLPMINDQVRFVSDMPNGIAVPNFRIITAYRTPSALLFQKTTENQMGLFPKGLEVVAAMGSAFAKKNLAGSGNKELLKTIDSCQNYFQGDSLYFQYLNALKVLLEKPPLDAPDFMKMEAWETKSCNTVLAGWAQLSHTWVLQSKNLGLVLCGMPPPPPGFVEPVPEFYSLMGELAAKTKDLLKENGAFEPKYSRLVREIETVRNILAVVKTQKEYDEKIKTLIEKESSYDEVVFDLMHTMRWKEEKGSEKYYKEIADHLNTLILDIKAGRLEQLKAEGGFRMQTINQELLWDKLEKICYRLNAIAHKQLRGVELNKSEAKFIRSYGESISEIMFYNDTTCFSAKDDAPRIVDVFSNAEKGKTSYLHVGIARARKLYVLYPWQGKTILCTGAIMPYYECVLPTRQTDDSWKTLLDSKDRPAIPDWFAPIVSGNKLSVPNLKKD